MRNSFILGMGILLAFVAGCQSSPAEQPTAAGLQAFIDGAIQRANRRAADLDGKTFVQEEARRRMIFFIPERTDLPPVSRPRILGLEPELQEDNLHPPPGAQCNKWIDRYALAQQVDYRYRLVKSGPIEPDAKGRPSASIELVVVWHYRVGTAESERPIPPTPSGMKIWPPPEYPKFFGAEMGGHSRELPGVRLPGRVAVDEVSPLVGQAVMRMNASPLKPKCGIVVVKAYYLATRDDYHIAAGQRWYIDTDAGPCQLPEMAYLYHGKRGQREGVVSFPATAPDE
ncbi:MAG: hypothetical protein BIFFINMI_02939 [Phycisphaerae bacterium]|nr:hypothetical protein [Phycisphaerae bacterium]